MAAEANKKTLLVESQYFPNISFYKALTDHEKLLIEKNEHYQKVSFRNRCYIAGPNGSILLSVPLARGKNQRTIMKDVRISNVDKWQALHWKTLVSAYRRSPWFEYYEEELGSLYEKQVTFLLDWNMQCFEWANKVIGVSTPVTFTEEYHKTYAPELSVTDARDIIRPGDKQVEEGTVRYTQVFQDRVGFLPDMSILDLIFCEGKRSLELLK
ncbi:WbqC family protein [Chitinophaga rhizophila]|uniref:WbqC family protein n=1 Tax=Chitinophaga rhizophila TaxID=2866212 RepID=A0ABS7GEA0_9BACT|nr:WbqC family protein [Chitinophaga rhizophila]MBW8684853.1 WbqC family protein [Chitinophaga rhizophila]